MRLALAALLLCSLSMPAVAADAIADQAEQAFRIFAGNLSQNDFLSAKIGASLFDSISGKWVRLNGPDPKSGMETYGADTAKFCKGSGALTLDAPTPLTLTISTNLSKANFSQVYTLVGGSTFAEHTDPSAYFEAIGLGPEITGADADQKRAVLLANANGRVEIFRPSTDILVMTREGSYPLVLARCPA